VLLEILGICMILFALCFYGFGFFLYLTMLLGAIHKTNLMVPACISMILLVPGLPVLSAIFIGGVLLTSVSFLLTASSSGSALIALGWILSAVISWMSYAIVGEESRFFRTRLLGCIPGVVGIMLMALGIFINLGVG